VSSVRNTIAYSNAVFTGASNSRRCGRGCPHLALRRGELRLQQALPRHVEGSRERLDAVVLRRQRLLVGEEHEVAQGPGLLEGEQLHLDREVLLGARVADRCRELVAVELVEHDRADAAPDQQQDDDAEADREAEPILSLRRTMVALLPGLLWPGARSGGA
jgi:hypothetical protein